MSPVVRKLVTVALAASLTVLALPALASADSPDVTSATGSVTNVAANGDVTVEVHGTWNWPTHGKDCNTDRAGVGIAVDWGDGNGNPVTVLNGRAIAVGVLNTTALNAQDNVAHPAEPPTLAAANATLANYATVWRSTCGQFIGGVPTGTWGTVTTTGEHYLTHKYTAQAAAAGLNICALTYDPHGSQANGPGSLKDVTAGGNGHNDDNSAEKNSQTPAGNTCAKVSLLTTDAGGTGTVGVPMHDTATLFGVTNDATGTITFDLYGPGGNCEPATKIASASSTATVHGGGMYVSADYTPTQAGTYHWIANYGGDAKNSATANGCGAAKEDVVVGPAGPTVTTNASADVTLGGSITDGATLSGGVNPTGSITFDLYGPNDTNCTGAVKFTSTIPVNGNGIYSSGAFTPTAAGTYRWIANYGGDANNSKTTNGCNGAHENVVVNPPGCTVNCSPPCTVNCSPTPAISIVKTGPATANAGDTIPYNLDVKNTGPVSFPAANVSLTDALCAATPTLVSRNGDTSPGSLDPNETWSYTCSVPTAAGQTFVHNVGCVAGVTAAGQTASACDDADTTLANQSVLPLLPGVARLRGPTGCIAARTHVLTVTGSRILRVSFYLDGRYIGTRTKPNRGSTFTMTIRGAKLRVGSHVVLAKVTYRPGSNPQTRTLTLAFARCARAVTPKFTG